MAQTATERRAAQRQLAKDLKAGKPIFTPTQKGQVKAARALGIRMADWKKLSPAKRQQKRNFVTNRTRAIKAYAEYRKSYHPYDDDFYPEDYWEDWQTWEWEIYRQGMGLKK